MIIVVKMVDKFWPTKYTYKIKEKIFYKDGNNYE